MAVLAVTFAVASARGQVPTGNAALQQARLFLERPDAVTSRTERLAPPADTLTGGESAADADLGEQWMLKPNLPPNPFTAHASLSLFYTDNVALARRSTLDDIFAVAAIGIGYSRTLAPDWVFAIDLQQSFFRYDQHSEFDFENFGANVALSYQARQLEDVVFSLQYGLSRLTSGALDDQLYLGNTVSLIATKLIPVTAAGSIDFTGAVGYTFADPDELERTEFRFAIGSRVRVARNFTATAAARVELYDYTNEPRTDLLQSIALGARYDLNQWIFLSASVSAARNVSTLPVFSYTAINVGVTLTATIQF